ncbi:MAG: histone deacetylase [Candidatus Micrarchaeota archaeon]|nr:histone deacetylase [Candidatus Micrarchaeota archaeon]
MKIFYSPKQLEFKGKFPDTAERVKAILECISKSRLKCTIVAPKAATRKDLERVHTKKYLDEIAAYRRINAYFPDEPIDAHTYKCAALSAGAAIAAAEYAAKSGKFAFALTRPKGNNAGMDFFGGYSYINNVAVAVAKLLAEKRAKRVLIVDFDAHFCNGTNNIFLNDERVWLLSFHQHADSIYPYLGREKDSTKRMRYCENHLWVTDAELVERFRKVLLEFAGEAKPDVIAVSAGFNTYYKDLFFGTVSKVRQPQTYAKIGRIIKLCAERERARVFGVLEGGYWVEDLGELVCNFLRPFAEVGPDVPDVVSDQKVL